MKKIKILDKQLDKLPSKVLFCKNCIVSNQRPRISFNKKGICSACEWSFEKNNKVNWKIREKELSELLNKHRKSNGEFDIVVPGSGGKDSAYVAHQLKYKYNMNPLCITWAPAEWSNIGSLNLESFINKGFYNIVARPDGEINRKISRLGFVHQGQPFIPFIYGQKAYPYQIANMYNIKLIMYGENGELEYGGSTKNKYKSHEDPSEWVEFYFKGTSVKDLVKMGFDTNVFNKKKHNIKSIVNAYSPPDYEIVREKNIQMHWWSYYKKWIPQENYYYASKFTDFKTNNFGRAEGSYTKYVGLDDKLDGLHWYLMYIKFGMGRATRDACQDIMMLHITRDEGVRLARLYDGEFPKKYHNWALKHLDISEELFWEVIDKYRSKKLWKKKNNGWELKYKVK